MDLQNQHEFAATVALAIAMVVMELVGVCFALIGKVHNQEHSQ